LGADWPRNHALDAAQIPHSRERTPTSPRPDQSSLFADPPSSDPNSTSSPLAAAGAVTTQRCGPSRPVLRQLVQFCHRVASRPTTAQRRRCGNNYFPGRRDNIVEYSPSQQRAAPTKPRVSLAYFGSSAFVGDVTSHGARYRRLRMRAVVVYNFRRRISFRRGIRAPQSRVRAFAGATIQHATSVPD